MPHPTDWMHQAKWGVMFHYVFGSEHMDIHTPAQWNDTVNTFDATALADQLESVGAGWLLLTISQHPPMNAPNTIFDEHLPTDPPRTTDRDLFLDVADALAAKNISLMAYSTYYAPTQMFEGDKDEHTLYPDWWPQGLADYSRRWGPKVRGWWFDGQRGNEDLNRRLAEAARAGNPEAIIAFNRPHGFQRNSRYENFTAGDTPHPPDAHCPTGRWAEDNLQWHMLSFLGYSWGPTCKRINNPRYADDFAAEKTTELTSAGGTVTWDLPPCTNGLVPEKYLKQLTAIGKATAKINH